MSLTPAQVARTAADQMLRGLDGVLAKAEAHAAEQEVDEAVYLNWRFTPDMFPMVRQVQIATELPVRGLARLAGQDVPSIPDTEESFADLRARVAKAKELVATISDEAINANPDGPITFPAGGAEMTLPRLAYLQGFILPNLYFHTSMTYGLLRACGVPIGKRDYLAAPSR